MAIQERGNAVHGANLGLYLDRPPLLVPERGVSAGLNFRVYNGQYTNNNMGWSAFNSLNLDSKPVLLIEEFEPTGGTRKLILGNTTDLFQYISSTLSYITPRYETGTASCAAGTTVTGSGTAWDTELKAGDFINFDGTGIVDPAATWYEIDSITNATSLELTAAGPNTGGAVSYTARQTFTSTIFDPYLTETFIGGSGVSGGDGDRWYATNGADPVVAWDGVTTQVYLPDLDTIETCKAIRRFKNVLIFIAPTYSGAIQGQTIRTSAIGQPENVTTLEASEFIVHDGTDNLINAYQIGELLAIYAEKAVILAQYVGTPVYYVFRTAVTGYGARSARGIIRFPTEHFLFSVDGQYSFDGVSMRPSSTHIWKEVARQSSPGRVSMVQGIIDQGNAELIWVTPLNIDADPDAGTPERAYIGHYLEAVGDAPMAHSLRELPATAIGSYIQNTTLTFDVITDTFDNVAYRWDDQQIQSAFPQVLFGTATGDIFSLGSTTQDGTVPVSFVRFSRRPTINSRNTGIIKRVYPGADFTDGSTGELTVNIRAFDTGNQAGADSETEYTIPLDGSKRFAPFRKQCRYFEIEMGTGPTHSGIWQIEGYDCDVVKGGSR